LNAPNRGHNSIACFNDDASSGRLTALGQVATEAVPSAFSLDPEGHFLFAAGSASKRLAAYRVNRDTGALTPLGTYDVGKRPMWVLITRLGG
jgi:6-phosphogluconolactonase